MYVYNVTMFTFTLILVLEQKANFGVRLPPGCSRQCTLFVCSNVTPLCLRMTGVSRMICS